MARVIPGPGSTWARTLLSSASGTEVSHPMSGSRSRMWSRALLAFIRAGKAEPHVRVDPGEVLGPCKHCGAPVTYGASTESADGRPEHYSCWKTASSRQVAPLVYASALHQALHLVSDVPPARAEVLALLGRADAMDSAGWILGLLDSMRVHIERCGTLLLAERARRLAKLRALRAEVAEHESKCR